MIDASSLYQKGRRQNEFNDENLAAILDALTNDHEYSRSISLEELRANEYTLNFSSYTSTDLAFENALPFENVIRSISRGAPYTAGSWIRWCQIMRRKCSTSCSRT